MCTQVVPKLCEGPPCWVSNGGRFRGKLKKSGVRLLSSRCTELLSCPTARAESPLERSTADHSRQWNLRSVGSNLFLPQVARCPARYSAGSSARADHQGKQSENSRSLG